MKISYKQILSFLLISGIGWLIDFSFYTILTKLFELNVMSSNMISAIPAVTYVFIVSTRKTFSKKTDSNLNIIIKYLIYFGYQVFLLFVVSYLGQALYNYAMTLNIKYDIILLNMKLIIKIVITPITMIANFMVMKNLIEKL